MQMNETEAKETEVYQKLYTEYKHSNHPFFNSLEALPLTTIQKVKMLFHLGKKVREHDIICVDEKWTNYVETKIKEYGWDITNKTK